MLACSGVADPGDAHSLDQHAARVASQLAHLESMLDRKGGINMQAPGASSFVPFMKVSSAAASSRVQFMAVCGAALTSREQTMEAFALGLDRLEASAHGPSQGDSEQCAWALTR